MPRKKKEAEKIEYPWSPYQRAIFDYIEHEHGHLVVEAAAGSGKSTTLIKCLDFIPNNDKVLLTAFNTDIVNELKKKTSDRPNVEVRTLHGLGLLFIKKNIPQASAIPEPFKYDSFIKNNIKELTSINTYTLRVGNTSDTLIISRNLLISVDTIYVKLLGIWTLSRKDMESIP